MTLCLQMPKRGHYLLQTPWRIDFDGYYGGNTDVQSTINRWIKKGAVQVSRTEVEIPAGVVFTLVKIELTPFRDKVVIRFHKKYNGNNNGFHEGQLSSNTSFLEGGVDANLLEDDVLDELVIDRRTR